MGLGGVFCDISGNADIESQRGCYGQHLNKIIQLREETDSTRAQRYREDFDLADIDQSVQYTGSA